MKYILNIFILLLFSGNSLISQELQSMPGSNMMDILKEGALADGENHSNFLLGVIYLNGSEEKGIKKDIKKAIFHFKKDSENSSYANYMLGFIYAKGLENKVDLEKAIRFFKKASLIKAVDSKEVAPVALAALGNIYLNYKNNKAEALPYLIEASKNKKMPNVDFTIALIYYTSKKPLQNKELAEYYLNKAYALADTELKAKIIKFTTSDTSVSKEEKCSKSL